MNRRASGVDGLELNVVDWGGDGTPLLFVHGFGHNARLWDGLVPALHGRYRVLALDNRGHGGSDADPEYRYHNAAVGRDLEAVAGQLELRDAVLVGHSQGGHACSRFAGRHPDRVRRLVLVDAGPDIRKSSPGAPSDGLRLLAPSFESVAAYETILAQIHPKLDPDERAALARNSLRVTEDGGFAPRLDPLFLRKKSKRSSERRVKFDRQAWAEKANARIWHYHALVRCPTLVIYGQHSPIVSKELVGRMVDDVMADGRAVEIPGAGHMVMLDEPAAFRSALLPFLLA